MRRRALLLLSLLAALAIAGLGLGVWLTMPNRHINPETFAKIQEGMTRQEVERLLGGPPGDYGPGEGLILYRLVNLSHQTAGRTTKCENWMAGSHAICIWFDDRDRVSATSLEGAWRQTDSILDRLLYALRLKSRPAGVIVPIINVTGVSPQDSTASGEE